MRFGVRSRLFVVSVALIVLGGIASAVYVELKLRAWLGAHLENEVIHAAQITREALSTHDPSEPGYPEVVDRLAEASGFRLSVVSRDGTVLGDSEVETTALPYLENHADRPEVATALAGETGIARRYSDTLQIQMVYVAMPLTIQGTDPVIVRAAAPLADLDSAVAWMRWLLLGAVLLGLLVAIFMSGLASHYLSRELRYLVKSARATASGEVQGRVKLREPRLGDAGSSVNTMAAELKALVAELGEERDRFEAVLEGMDDGVIAMDAEGRLILANKSAESLFSLAPNALGRPFEKVINVKRLSKLLAKDLRGKDEPNTVEFEIGAKPRIVLARATRLRATGGAVVVMHDITRLRHLETIRRDFVANVSHELRTPVSVVRANSETLLDGALDDDPVQARVFVEAILRNAERLSRLIADLLDISRIESGVYAVNPSPLNAKRAVSRAMDAIKPAADKKGTKLVVQVPPDLTIMADSKALDQILLNLLENAVKYTPASSHVEVEVRAQNEHEARIEVRDDGPGIEAKHHGRIFERFYRIDPGRSRNMGGTGLGLAIVKHLVTAMRGTVGFEPKTPNGSCFWIVLPTPEGAAASPRDELDN
ncbi:MAG: PAS domain-containing protein [Myxococcales bacterium]|nr:PAS domain-containing protein [Myxococcales bacterium]